MAYITFRTAAGHVLTINPRKQRSLFWSIQDGLIAEGRLSEKQLSYEDYRRRRGHLELLESSISIAQSLKKQLDKIDDSTFDQFDKGILALAKRPTQAGSMPRHHRWFLGNLRRVMVGDFPVLYTLAEDGNLRILYIGYRRWDESVTLPAGRPTSKATKGTRLLEKKKSRPDSSAKRTDRFITYSGETPDELFSYPLEGQADALVQAFREAIQQKAQNKGNTSLTDEERIVLAVTALEEEVNNGGYDQFFRNESRKFAPVIVSSLTRIGCNNEAKITEKALGALHARKFDESTIEAAMSDDDVGRDEELHRCDDLFYQTQKGMAGRLYAFIKAHRAQISFP